MAIPSALQQMSEHYCPPMATGQATSRAASARYAFLASEVDAGGGGGGVSPFPSFLVLRAYFHSVHLQGLRVKKLLLVTLTKGILPETTLGSFHAQHPR